MLVLASARAGAQTAVRSESVWLEQFRAEGSPYDGLMVRRPFGLGLGGFSAQATLSYSNSPLGVYLIPRNETLVRITDSWVLHTAIGVGIVDALTIYAGLPIQLAMFGVNSSLAPGPDPVGIGDAWLNARFSFFGGPHDPFSVGASLRASFPTARLLSGDNNKGQHYSGEQTFVLSPELLLEVRTDILRVTGNAGLRLRTDNQPDLERLQVGQEATWALGVTIPVIRANGRDRFNLYGEGFGAFSLENVRGNTSPVEAILGLRLYPVDELSFTLGGGMGITQGYGSPAYRIVAGVSIATPEARDRHTEDSDGDGISDRDDACASEAEDRDAFEDDDGCPDPDNDRDQVLDTHDRAPNDPEDRDGFEDEDGAPDLDDDGDGIPDARDRAPRDPEDFDQYQDEDGAPEPDNDGDGVMDENDRCPLEAGQSSDDPSRNGCPPWIRVDENRGRVSLVQPVVFPTGSDRITQESNNALLLVTEILTENPGTVVRVEGHTDDRGPNSTNMELSTRRAQALIRWFRAHQVDLARIEAWGCGEFVPVTPNTTRSGRQANRRVEFRLSTNGVPISEGNLSTCVRAQ